MAIPGADEPVVILPTVDAGSNAIDADVSPIEASDGLDAKSD
jgi:hypothetical protein